MIVIEGMDGSGKSTLAAALSEWLGWPVLHPGGPPKTLSDTKRSVEMCIDRMGQRCIQDRVTMLSEVAYGTFAGRNDHAGLALLSTLAVAKRAAIVIYCRPPAEFVTAKLCEQHVVKDHDTPEHLEMVLANAARILAVYDTLYASLRVIGRTHAYNYLEKGALDDVKRAVYWALPFAHRPMELKKP